MSKFRKFSINNKNYNTAYRLDLKMILISICCYFLNPAIAIVVFAISLSKGNKFIAYHAFHSVIVSVLISAIFYCLAFLKIGFLINILRIVFRIALNIFAIYGSYHLLNNRTYTLPFISNIFNKYIK